MRARGVFVAAHRLGGALTHPLTPPLVPRLCFLLSVVYKLLMLRPVFVRRLPILVLVFGIATVLGVSPKVDVPHPDIVATLAECVGLLPITPRLILIAGHCGWWKERRVLVVREWGLDGDESAVN